jgi:hypothetical protein
MEWVGEDPEPGILLLQQTKNKGFSEVPPKPGFVPAHNSNLNVLN